MNIKKYYTINALRVLFYIIMWNEICFVKNFNLCEYWYMVTSETRKTSTPKIKKELVEVVMCVQTVQK